MTNNKITCLDCGQEGDGKWGESHNCQKNDNLREELQSVYSLIQKGAITAHQFYLYEKGERSQALTDQRREIVEMIEEAFDGEELLYGEWLKIKDTLSDPLLAEDK